MLGRIALSLMVILTIVYKIILMYNKIIIYHLFISYFIFLGGTTYQEDGLVSFWLTYLMGNRRETKSL